MKLLIDLEVEVLDYFKEQAKKNGRDRKKEIQFTLTELAKKK